MDLAVSFSLASFSWMSENTRTDLDRLALWLVINLVDLRRKVLVDMMLLMMSENINRIYNNNNS